MSNRSELLDLKSIRVNDQERSIITVLITVVRGTKYGKNRRNRRVIEQEVFLIALLLHLVRPNDAAELIGLQELSYGLWPILVARVSDRIRDVFDVLPFLVLDALERRGLVLIHRIAPHDVTERSTGGNFGKTVKAVDVRKLAEPWPDPAVHADAVPVGGPPDVSREREGVKEKLGLFEELGAVLVLTFEVEGHVLSEKTGLVVPTEHDDVLGIDDLESAEEENNFGTEVATVDVIA